jgi:predicted transcriptional regulator
LDPQYFEDEDQALMDFSVDEHDLVNLTNCIIDLLSVHENGLDPNRVRMSLHIFSSVMVDNMVRNLEAGRKAARSKRQKKGEVDPCAD